jgi:hypothetical protein
VNAFGTVWPVSGNAVAKTARRARSGYRILFIINATSFLEIDGANLQKEAGNQRAAF